MKQYIVMLSAFVILLSWSYLLLNSSDSLPDKIGEINAVVRVVENPELKEERLYFGEEERGAYPSRLVDELNVPESSIEKDLELLGALFRHFRTAYRENPVGTHEQIVARLTGNNPNQVAYIPTAHPALQRGKLLDRWGTPFYFHQISDEVMEIRSAGPDGRHWNSDDIFLR